MYKHTKLYGSSSLFFLFEKYLKRQTFLWNEYKFRMYSITGKNSLFSSSKANHHYLRRVKWILGRIQNSNRVNLNYLSITSEQTVFRPAMRFSQSEMKNNLIISIHLFILTARTKIHICDIIFWKNEHTNSKREKAALRFGFDQSSAAASEQMDCRGQKKAFSRSQTMRTHRHKIHSGHDEE